MTDTSATKVSYNSVARIVVIVGFLFFCALTVMSWLQARSWVTVGFAFLFIVIDVILWPFVFFSDIGFCKSWDYFIITFCHHQYKINYSDCSSYDKEGDQFIIRLCPNIALRVGCLYKTQRIVLDGFITNREPFLKMLQNKHVPFGCRKVNETVVIKTRESVIAFLFFYMVVSLLLYIYVMLEGSQEVYRADAVLINTVFGINFAIPVVALISCQTRKIIYSIGSNCMIYRRIGMNKTILLSQITDIRRKLSTETVCITYLNGTKSKRLRIYYPNSQIQPFPKAWHTTLSE